LFRHYFKYFSGKAPKQARPAVNRENPLNNIDGLMEILAQVGNRFPSLLPFIEALIKTADSHEPPPNSTFTTFSDMVSTFLRFFAQTRGQRLALPYFAESLDYQPRQGGFFLGMTLPRIECTASEPGFTVEMRNFRLVPGSNAICSDGNFVYTAGIIGETPSVVSYPIFMGTTLIDSPRMSTIETNKISGMYFSSNGLCVLVPRFRLVKRNLMDPFWTKIPIVYRSATRMYCGDGIVFVGVEVNPRLLSVDLEYDSTPRRAFQMKRPSIPELERILKTNFFMETNGAFILFLASTYQTTSVVALSMKDGAIVYVNEIQNPRGALEAVTYDSINGCHWGIWNYGHYHLRRINALASVDPFLVNPMFWPTNPKLWHYIGLPDPGVGTGGDKLWANLLAVPKPEMEFPQDFSRMNLVERSARYGRSIEAPQSPWLFYYFASIFQTEDNCDQAFRVFGQLGRCNPRHIFSLAPEVIPVWDCVEMSGV
jgi:hypothetical protein